MSFSPKLPLAALCAVLAWPAAAQVRFLAGPKTFILDTAHVSYAVGVNPRNQLQHLYWGAKLTRDEDFPAARPAGDFAFENSEGLTREEYPGWGGMRFAVPSLKVTFENGVRDLVLRYASHQVHGNELEIRLKDIQYELFVTLRYRVYPENDIVRKLALIENRTAAPVVVESAQSGVWHLPPGEGYRLGYLHGRWAGETQLVREDIHPGEKVLESRRGNTSHQLNPWFAIDGPQRAAEEFGRVWFGSLGWSGNWRITVEQTPYQQVRVTGGLNDFDFAYPLKPGESLETPPFYGGFTEAGFGEASRIFHRFQNSQILPDHAQPKPRPVLYNSWEATTFNVDEPGQKALAEKAAKIGVELFVMDDGWFGKRDHDRAGLGDWFVNTRKFPNGLGPLIRQVESLGMKFGLWVEPEMVNPDSDLYRAHPDWALNFPDRPRTPSRNQLILNMARDDVKEYIFGVLDKLATENDIAFFKWDMNRHFTEPGWPAVPPGEQKKVWVKYVTNVYEIFDRLRQKHPNLEIESCSGGGGRIDLGILTRVNQVWTSDNTEAFDRLRIQDGYAQAYTPKAMMAWVTDVPNMNDRSTPLVYRFLVAMQGSLGIGSNLNHWHDEDFALATKMVALYKSIRATVQQGSLYRLLSPREGEVTANQYIGADGRQSALFVFLRSQQFRLPIAPVYLRGLDPQALYRVQPLDAGKIEDRRETVSGSFLMNQGLRLRMRGDYDSTLVVLEKVR